MTDHIDRAAEIIDAHIRGWPTTGRGLPDSIARHLNATGLLATPGHDAEVAQVDYLSGKYPEFIRKHDRQVAAKALREAADRLADMTEGHERIGTSKWTSEADRDAYSLAIEETSSALRSMAAGLIEAGESDADAK